MYGFYLCPKYADDITYVTTSLEKLEEIEKDTPLKLKSYNLQVNQSKTEKYQIPRPIPEQYLPELDINTNKNVLWSELDLSLKLLLNILKDFPHSPTRKGLVILKFTPSNVEERDIL